MGSFSIWHWLIVLLIVVLIFGTKKLGNIGKDLGSAVRGFKEGMFPVAESVGRHIVTLPLFPRMSEADVERVVKAVREVLAS